MRCKSMLALFLSAVLLISFTGCAETEADEKNYIAVITKSTRSDFWKDVKRGVESAATEYNVDITFEGPEKEEDYLAQNELIEKAVKNHADAIVLSAIDYSGNARAAEKAAQSGVQIISIDSDVACKEKAVFIGTDNYEAGRRAAEAAVKAAAEEKEINIGLVNYLEDTDNGQKRENGVKDYIDTIPNAKIVDVVNVASDSTSASAGARGILHNHPEINVLIGFNEWTTLGIGYAIRQLPDPDTVCGIGFDNNTICIGMLETGELDALIVQNPFAIGYLGVANAARLTSGKNMLPNTETSVVEVTSENMFDEDIQKLIFQFN